MQTRTYLAMKWGLVKAWGIVSVALGALMIFRSGAIVLLGIGIVCYIVASFAEIIEGGVRARRKMKQSMDVHPLVTGIVEPYSKSINYIGKWEDVSSLWNQAISIIADLQKEGCLRQTSALDFTSLTIQQDDSFTDCFTRINGIANPLLRFYLNEVVSGRRRITCDCYGSNLMVDMEISEAMLNFTCWSDASLRISVKSAFQSFFDKIEKLEKERSG